MRRVAGVFLAASLQIPLELLGAAEMEAFIDCCGCSVDKSKTEYLKLLPKVYNAVSKMAAVETSTVCIGSFMYNG